MKILKIISILLIAITSTFAELYVDSAKIDNNAVVNSQEKDVVEATFKLPKVKRIPFAAITVEGEIKDTKQIYPSLLISVGDHPVASRTILNKKGKFGALFVVTREIRDAIRENKESIDVKISMSGKNQTACEIKSASLKVLINEKHFRTSIYMRPVFSGDETIAESIFPLGDADAKKPVTAKLLFKPTEILEAYTLSSGKKVELQKDKDYKINGDTIEFLPNSNVKIIPYSEMYADTKEQAKNLGANFHFSVIKKYAKFREGNWFHSHMVYISYKHMATNEKVGEKYDDTILPNTITFLKEKRPLRIALYGDSISQGANASGHSLTIPFAPSWGDYVAQELKRYYRAPVVYFNRALGGTNSTWGNTQIEELVCPDKPDLVILAFGMNDRLPAEKFKENIQSMISKIRKVNPSAEIILVTSMLANPLWHNFPVHDEYAKVCASLQTKGVAVADVRAVHKRLLKQKRFIDMTGNNVNHPNDFLIRIYAQTILQKLIPTMSK